MSKKQDQSNNNKTKNNLLNGSAEEFELVELKTTQETELENLEYIEKKPFFKRTWEWLTKDKQRLWSIIFLFLFVVLIIVLAALNLNLGEIMRNIVDWFQMKIGIWGIFIGVFVISIFGNFTVIFPIPYTLA